MFALMRMMLGLSALVVFFGLGYIVAPKGGDGLSVGAFCDVVESAQSVVDTGVPLVSDLQDWVNTAEGLLNTVNSMTDTSQETRSGLGSLLDKAESVATGAAGAALDVVTAPIQTLIDMAKVALVVVQKAINAAQSVISHVDANVCS